MLQPTKAFCGFCCNVHTDKVIDGELFELCAECQAELTAFTFEESCNRRSRLPPCKVAHPTKDRR